MKSQKKSMNIGEASFLPILPKMKKAVRHLGTVKNEAAPPKYFSPSEKYQKSVPKFTKIDVPRHPEYNLKLKI